MKRLVYNYIILAFIPFVLIHSKTELSIRSNFIGNEKKCLVKN